MTSLFVDRKEARLSLDRGALRVQAGGECLTLPLGTIERIIVRGQASLDTGLLSSLWGRGIGLLLLSGRRSTPTARFHGQPVNDVRRRMAQTLIACDPSRALAVARPVVAAKLAAQSRALRRIARVRPSVLREAIAFDRLHRDLAATLATVESLDALRGCEGFAARHYWRGLTGAFAPSLNFRGRNRRPPRDPVNAALSLAYTVATAEAGGRAQRHGLDPMIGFLHAPSFGRESLACDLVEPLRPRIDLWIEILFRERRLRREHFTDDADGACLLGKAGRAAFYQALDDQLPVWSRWLGQAARLIARGLDASPAPDFAALDHSGEDEFFAEIATANPPPAHPEMAMPG